MKVNKVSGIALVYLPLTVAAVSGFFFCFDRNTDKSPHTPRELLYFPPAPFDRFFISTEVKSYQYRTFHVKLLEKYKKKEIKMTDFKYFRKRSPEEYAVSSQVLQVKTDDIRPNRAQPRADFDNNSLIRLADSIRRYGII